MSKKTFFAVSFLLLLSQFGCAKLSHLSQLLTLKRYSDNKELQAAHVCEENESFEKMIAVLRAGRFSQLKTREQFSEDIGQPNVVFLKQKNGREYETWLYRRSGTLKDGEKVYLYFDERGDLVTHEHYVPVFLERNFSDTKYRGGPS